MKIIFDTLNVYYLPHFLPVYEELDRRGHDCHFVCYENKNDKSRYDQCFSSQKLNVVWFNDQEESLRYYQQRQPDWIIFGNGYSLVDQLSEQTKTCQLNHGIGPKMCYYTISKDKMTVRFIEGDLRLEKIRGLFPDDNFIQTGYSKLDPLFKGDTTYADISSLGLDKKKPTLLYAPTFSPSSLGKFSEKFPSDFSEFNIIIKPHSFIYARKSYKADRQRLKKWQQYENVCVANAEELSLLPFMNYADIMVSEASSALFEFAALNKPVIVCNFFKLKWSHRGLLHYRFKRRFGLDNFIYKDIGVHVNSYSDLKENVLDQIKNPDMFQENRARYTQEHVGKVDGKVSERIADYLESYELICNS